MEVAEGNPFLEGRDSEILAASLNGRGYVVKVRAPEN